MTVQEIDSVLEVEAFLSEVKPHTFLDSWNWGEFEKSMWHKVWRLGVYENNTLIALTTVAKTVARRGIFLVWHHGPVIKSSFTDRAHKKNILELLRNKSIEIAKKEHCHFLRVSTVLTDTEENRTLFKELGFRNAPIHLHSELGWILDITKPEEELLQAMRKNTRYAIRKAEKDGVVIEKSSSLEDFEKFWAIYMETVQRQNFTPYSREYLYNEFKAFINDGKAFLFFGKYKEQYITTAFIVYTTNSAFYHHGASVHLFPGISASELLQWEAIKEAKRRGCTTYNFWGVVPEDAQKHPWYGLSRFKRGFGGNEEAHVHAQDYVLHPKYWLTFLVEKIRKIRRGV
jgi:peptidoglycan pentaglycine glycine transferase (the first glycine)